MYSDITENTQKFYLTGESYAGKYLPLFTYELLEYNKKNNHKLPLLATIIIDPYSTPIL
jgi:carboxypeptidase C (cathepsin A)